MDERGRASAWRRSVLAGIILLFLVPVEASLLQLSAVPISVYYLVVFTSAGSILAFLAYVSVHLGRNVLLRLFPVWLAKWPHERIAQVVLVGLFLWYLVDMIWKPGPLVERLVWGELTTLLILELYAFQVTTPRKRLDFGRHAS